MVRLGVLRRSVLRTSRRLSSSSLLPGAPRLLAFRLSAARTISPPLRLSPIFARIRCSGWRMRRRPSRTLSVSRYPFLPLPRHTRPFGVRARLPRPPWRPCTTLAVWTCTRSAGLAGSPPTRTGVRLLMWSILSRPGPHSRVCLSCGLCLDRPPRVPRIFRSTIGLSFGPRAFFAHCPDASVRGGWRVHLRF